MQNNKQPDSLSEQEKILLGIESIKCFFDQFGPDDIYKEIFLTTLFEELLNVQSIPVPDQKRP